MRFASVQHWLSTRAAARSYSLFWKNFRNGHVELIIGRLFFRFGF